MAKKPEDHTYEGVRIGKQFDPRQWYAAQGYPYEELRKMIAEKCGPEDRVCGCGNCGQAIEIASKAAAQMLSTDCAKWHHVVMELTMMMYMSARITASYNKTNDLGAIFGLSPDIMDLVQDIANIQYLGKIRAEVIIEKNANIGGKLMEEVLLPAIKNRKSRNARK